MLSKIFSWFGSAFEAVLVWFKSLVLTLWDMFADFLVFVVDSLLGLAISILNTIAVPLNFNPTSYISALPDDVINMFGLIGLGECVSIITSAILIRLLLQLIPFVRLGS